MSLTVHRAARPRALPLLQLRDAGAEGLRATAPAPYLEQIGFGTERVEAEIRERFPAARVARVDRDTIRRRGAIAALLSRVRRAASSTCSSARR